MEYWIEVKGHPRYQVSTLGRVKCLSWGRTGKEKILKPYKTDTGYLRIPIDGKPMFVHRVVLSSFMPNPQNKPEIDHINTIKTDNRIENLRWVTHKENDSNPLSRKHRSEKHSKYWLGKFGGSNASSKQVVQLTKNGSFVKKWACMSEAERELNMPHQLISKCCLGKRKTTGGFKWVYASDYQKHISDIKPLF